jgi:site-specific recombinase XerD
MTMTVTMTVTVCMTMTDDHESITTTEIYTHLDREYLRDSIIQFHPRSRK